MTHSPSSTLIQTLRRQIDHLENGRRTRPPAILSSGCPQFDQFLPDGGFRRGSLVEWLTAEEGCGAQSLALMVAREACRENGGLVVLDRTQQFYPPAAVRMGIESANLLVVRPENQADELWALTQTLRCPGVAAALVWLDHLGSHDFRRLQLAAESEQALGLLLRPQTARKEPSWAHLRLVVQPLPSPESAEMRRLKIHLLHSHRGAGYGTIELELHEQTDPLHLVARLACPAANTRSARAV